MSKLLSVMRFRFSFSSTVVYPQKADSHISLDIRPNAMLKLRK